MIQVNTQVTQQDFIRFNLYYFISKPKIWFYMLIIGFVFSSFFFNFNDNGIEAYAVAGLFNKLIPFLFILGVFTASCWAVYKQSKRNYKATASIHEPVVYTFSEAGVHSKGRSFESDVKWELVHKVEETKDWFLIYQNNIAANLIPKSAFASQEQVHNVRSLISGQKNLKQKLRKDEPTIKKL